VQEQTAAESEEKSRLRSKVDEMTTTVERLSADVEGRRVEAETVTEELLQAKLSLDVSYVM